MGSRKYPLLNDDVWLRQKYLDEGLAPKIIAEIVGAANEASVRQALIRLGIPRRGYREAQVHRREHDGFILNGPVITGCLLGDASLEVSNKHSAECAPRFVTGHVNLGHVQFTAAALFENGGGDKIAERTTFHKQIGRSYTWYVLQSQTHECLQPIFDQWYPEEHGYRKSVPMDIEMTPEVLLHWFLDDGFSTLRRRGVDGKSQQVLVTLCSESFSVEDQEGLCAIINSRFDLDARLIRYHAGVGWRISIPQSRSTLFFEIIGPSPVPSLDYKWKTPVSTKRSAFPLLHDPDWMYQTYVINGTGVREIARMLGMKSHSPVMRAIARHRQDNWIRIEK